MKKIVLFALLLPLIACGQIKIPLKNKTAGASSLFFPLSTKTSSTQPPIVITIPGIGQLTNGVIPYSVFKIPAGTSRVSVGVYNTSTNVLVRTIVSGIAPDELKNGLQWDGYLDDRTTLAPLGNYTVQVLCNNVQYNWGVMGNSSKYLFKNRFVNYGGVTGMAFAANRGFFGYGFYEGDYEDTNNIYFSSDSIQVANKITGIPGAIVTDYCTDGTYIYHAMADQYNYDSAPAHMNYIYVTKASDNTLVNLSGGISHQTGRERSVYSGLIGFRADGDIQYTGVAVNTNYIFATRKDANLLYIFDKNGVKQDSLSFTKPGKIAAKDGFLWMIVNGSVNKYAINTAHSLSLVTSLSGLSAPMTLTLSPDKSTVLVVDAGASQQIKAFSDSNYSLLWTLGDQGGYVTNGAAVTNTKFMFDNGYYATPVIACQPDGSFWVNDVGNYRMMHFNANRTFKERICYVPSCRSINIDPNNPNKVFADELEFYRDYTKTLDNGSNGSWYLKNNWKLGAPLEDFGKLGQVITFSNGHTYATNVKENNDLYDLLPAGRTTVGQKPSGILQPDGSVEHRNILNNGAAIQITNQAVTGYSGNMPQWGAPVQQLYNTQSLPVNYDNNTRGSSTNAKRYFYYQPHFFGGFHLAGVDKAPGNKVAFLTSDTTPEDYYGPYPTDGHFQLSGSSDLCLVNVQGSNVFWHVNSELGFQIETCRTNHYDEDGLFVGHFGNDIATAQLTGNSTFLAGNSFSTQTAMVGNDIYYDYCDENRFGGVHEVRVSNLASIQKQNISLTVSAGIKKVFDPYSLMAKLPYKSSNLNDIANTTTKWNIELNENQTQISTNINKFLRDTVDIFFKTYNGRLIASYPLNSQRLNTWDLSGQLLISGTEDGANRKNRMDLVDINGKVIFRLETKYDWIVVNENYDYATTFLTGKTGLAAVFNNIHFQYNGSSMIFTYLNKTISVNSTFESGALLNSPGKLRVYQISNGQDKIIDLAKLRFVTGN